MTLLDQQYKAVPKEDILKFREFINAYTSNSESKIDRLVEENKNVSELFVLIERTKVKDRFIKSFARFEMNYRWNHKEMFELLQNEKDYWSGLDLHNNDLLVSGDHRATIEYYLSILAMDFLRMADTPFKEGWNNAVEEFEKLDAHPDYKEFAHAVKINQELGFLGLKESRDDYNSFLETYPESIFITPLNRKFAPWLALDKGKIAPDFSGINPEGEEISLHDFIGKVVYIDVWASWCNPCYKEFPYSMDLKKRFDNDQVVFLYVSIDDDQDAWKKGMARVPELGGNHMLVENAWQSDFAEKYSVKDIPRYILIDREGKMADMQADIPSSKDVIADKIRNLL